LAKSDQKIEYVSRAVPGHQWFSHPNHLKLLHSNLVCSYARFMVSFCEQRILPVQYLSVALNSFEKKRFYTVPKYMIATPMQKERQIKKNQKKLYINYQEKTRCTT